jgi:hypothetical protein
MTRTSKSERKYGKPEEKLIKPKVKPKKREDKPEIEMFKIMVDGSGFTNKMTYEECLAFIAKVEESHKKSNSRTLPSLIIVKQ